METVNSEKYSKQTPRNPKLAKEMLINKYINFRKMIFVIKENGKFLKKSPTIM